MTHWPADLRNNTLKGRDGDDMLYGGQDGGDDKIDLSAFADITSVDDLSMDQREGDAVIDLSNQGGGSITLQDFVIADLDASDFIF